MSHAHAAVLRRRAHRLRRLASRIERSAAMHLERHADADTWRGRRPTLCIDLLRTNQARLHQEIDDLRWQAYLFEQRAADLETRAALGAGRAG